MARRLASAAASLVAPLALLLACLAAAVWGQKVTFVINAESCEETTLNQAFTRTALANNSCAIIPGLDHISLECTGTNGTATGYLWGILNTECDPDFGRPTVNLTLYDGCNVRIGGTLVSAYLEGCPTGKGRAKKGGK